MYSLEPRYPRHCPRVADSWRRCVASSSHSRRPCPIMYRPWACRKMETGPDGQGWPRPTHAHLHQVSSSGDRLCQLSKLTGVGWRPFIPHLRLFGGDLRARPSKFKQDSTTAADFKNPGVHVTSGPRRQIRLIKAVATGPRAHFSATRGGGAPAETAASCTVSTLGPRVISNRCHVSITVRKSRTV